MVVGIYALFFTVTVQKIKTEQFLAPSTGVRLSIQVATSLQASPYTRISRYDSHIERVSSEYKVDWRMTAAVISIESSFNEKARSKAGAIGLMQVMPIVYREQNVPIEDHPTTNMKVGLAHFKNLHGRISAETAEDRIKMTFAAYNAGMGHLRDAQQLARAKKLNPKKWSDLAKVYPMLEIPYVYKSFKSGYCQGRNVVDYVKKVSKQYEKFQKHYPENRPQLTWAHSQTTATSS